MIINGNFTSSGSISISGINSQVIVTECLFLAKGAVVSIHVTKSEVEGLGAAQATKQFLSASCGTDLSSVTPSVIVTEDSGCKRLKSKNVSIKESLAIAFTMDAAKCSRVAIIVPSVVSGVLLVVASVSLAHYVYSRYFAPQKVAPRVSAVTQP